MAEPATDPRFRGRDAETDVLDHPRRNRATAGTALMSVLRSRFSAATVHRDDGVKA